jgi:hypothetical protein
MPRTRAEPALSTTWLRIASLRLDRQHITTRLPARLLLDVVDGHVEHRDEVRHRQRLVFSGARG